MKPHNLMPLSLLGTCLAEGQWKTVDCGSDAAIIEKAFSDAITIAETAEDVLENDYRSNPAVKQMVEYILGSGEALQSKVDKAKELLGNIKRYDKRPAMFLGRPGGDNKDVIINCKSRYIMRKPNSKPGTVPRLWHQDLRMWVSTEHARLADICFDENAGLGMNLDLLIAATLSSDQADDTLYKEELARWEAEGAPLPPGPDISKYMVERPDFLNAMDLCNWYLRFVQTNGRGFARFMAEDAEGSTQINRGVINTIMDDNFNLQGTGNNRIIDVLTQSLAGTLLHELSHTNLGGKTVDMPPGMCYGWNCIKELHNPMNADSLNHLGVAMYLWKNGYRVDEGGKVKPL